MLAQGEIKVSRGGGRCVEFTDIETSSVQPSAKEVLGKGCNVYPPPVADSGDWTDTENRVSCKVALIRVSGKGHEVVDIVRFISFGVISSLH